MAIEKRVRDISVNVRFDQRGVATLDGKRKGLSRGEYIRQAVAFAIRMGFDPKDDF
jgi:hypothetical protein